MKLESADIGTDPASKQILTGRTGSAVMPLKKRLSRKAAFLDWVSEKSGFGHYSELMVQQSMEDSDTFIGVAWAAWKAAWRLKP